MTKAPTPTEMSEGQSENTNNVQCNKKLILMFRNILFCYVENRKPYDSEVWKVNKLDKLSGRVPFTILSRRMPLLSSALSTHMPLTLISFP